MRPPCLSAEGSLLYMQNACCQQKTLRGGPLALSVLTVKVPGSNHAGSLRARRLPRTFLPCSLGHRGTPQAVGPSWSMPLSNGRSTELSVKPKQLFAGGLSLNLSMSLGLQGWIRHLCSGCFGVKRPL